jgi:hypothetical protein
MRCHTDLAERIPPSRARPLMTPKKTASEEIGGDGRDTSRLGQMVMHVREKLRHGDTQGNNPAEAGL